MTKQKTTKKTLLTSVLSLVLCMAMLVGTTFAWFTDSVTSANNKIQAGNLDIELEYYTGTEWETVEDATELFTGNLWEPGHTEVLYLRLTNKGTLALKYQLGVNIVSETGSVNVEGDNFKLSQYIEYGVVEGKEPSYAKREDAVAAVKDSSIAIASGYSKNGYMEEQNDTLYLAMVVYMPETVGNEANYATGATVPSINLGVNLLATQYTYESDSFDAMYDEDATFGTYIELKEGEDLLAAMASAEADMPLTIKLLGNTEWPTEGHHGENDITPASSIVIDGNGYTITATGSGVTPLGDTEAPMTLKNAKIVDKSVSYTETSWEFSYLEMGGKILNCVNVDFADPIMVESDAANFTDCSFVGYEDTINGIKMNGVWMYNGDANYTNCTFMGTRGMKICDMYTSGEVGTVVIDGCRFIGLTQKPGVAIDDYDTKDMKITIKNSTFIQCQPGDQGLYVYETDNTVPTVESNVVDNETKVASDGASLNNAIANAQDDGTVILTDDVDYGTTQLAISKKITIDLNGKELNTANNWGGITLKNGASIKNGTVNHTGNTAAIKAFQVDAIENVTINVTETAGKTKGGIVIQSGAETYIGSLKNVTITGATNGIETYNCGNSDRAKMVIGSMENVNIDATHTGILLSAPIGKVTNCNIKGAEIGINMLLKGEYKVSIELVDSVVTGAKAGIWAHDEVGIPNTTNCSLTLTYDAKTIINGGLEWDFEDECQSVIKLNAPSGN